MIKKVINQISVPLHDLLECLVAYSEHLETPPHGAEVLPDSEIAPTKRSFILDTPDRKLQAIECILWGDEEIKKRRGNIYSAYFFPLLH